uniref:Uncharacterized protein n=1 Tax=Arundo donax TaxID=35708 RepID=A0A0A9D8K9_ARUDO
MMSLMCPPPPPPLLPPVVTRRRDTHPSPRLTWGARAPEHLLGGGGDAVGPGNSGLGSELGEPQKIGAVEGNSVGFVMLTESIQKFGVVFERIESRKRQHMAEVEQMRRDFQRDLDAKWREILEKAQAEIACLGDEDVDESDVEEDGDGGNDNKRLEDGAGEEQNNGAMDASP